MKEEVVIAKPDVSVIIPTYNRLWALPQTIESCRHSKCRTEIVVVDDGSTDDTWSWLQTQKDVIAIKTDNWGQCWAQNAGFASSTGEFVRFLDSDDWLLSGANDRQLEIARTTQADVVVAGYETYDQVSGCKVDIPWIGCGDFLVDHINADNFYSAYLLRRSLVASIPQREEFPLSDCTFVIELALAKPSIAVGRFSAVVFRIHADGHQSDRKGLPLAIATWRTIVLYRKVLSLLKQRKECTDLRRDVLLRAVWHAARALAEWDMKEATAVVDWIREQDEKFRPPVCGLMNKLYRVMGFEIMERVARIRRTVLNAVR